MPTPLGAHNSQLASVRELLTKKGRREQHRFSFEGATLLGEALDAAVPVEAVYATAEAFERHPECSRAERAAVPVHLIDERSLARISDVETPQGIVSVAPAVYANLESMLEAPGLVLLLAGISDPGNAGTLLRSAEAFGVDRVIFGEGCVEPYHPKVVRGAMGAVFRIAVATASPAELGAAARPAWTVIGLDARGEPLGSMAWPERAILAVGSERQGLGTFEGICARTAAIPMPGKAESLNAAVAGSIALYEATRRSSNKGS